jgi:hypothetical protein
MSTSDPASSSSSSPAHPGWIVLLAGVATSAAVLWIVSVLADSGTNVMGWYLFIFVPVGALIVGVLSGLGYAIASRKVNMTLTPGFVVSMVFIALVDYVANQYVTYASLMERLHAPPQYTFLNYLRDICENMTFSQQADGQPGSPIGVLGYLFKTLEVLGYVAGATIPAKMTVQSVASTPDCIKCRQYYVPKRFGYLNAPERWADLVELPYVERILALKKSCAPLIERTETLMDSLEGKTFNEASRVVSGLDSEATMGNTASVSFTLRKCPGCDAFHLKATIVGYEVDGTFASQHLRSVESSGVPEGGLA